MYRRLLAAVVCGLALPAGAAAQRPDAGLFSVSPSTRTVVDRPPVALAPATVGNTTRSTLQVDVIPVLLGQEVSGALTFSERPADLDKARRIVRSGLTSFSMAPGTTRSVPLSWDLLPTADRAAFVGVVFQARAKPEPGQTVRTVQRLLTSDFLRLPGPVDVTGRLTRLPASQGPDRTIAFAPRIRNTGTFVGKPVNARFAIRDASGRIVVRQTLRGEVILPGFQREFPLRVRKLLPAGDYTAIARADFGRSRGLRIATRFRLVGPNRLPTGRVALREFRAAGVLGGDSRVTGVLQSTGTKAADTAVRVSLFRLSGGQRPVRPMVTRRLTFQALEPGTTKDLKVTFPSLPAGDYRVIGTYRDAVGSTKEVISDFSPHAERGGWQRLEDFLGRHRVLGGSLLAALVLAALLLRRRRRSAAGVSLNTADAATLATLPGVGPRAAQRIVDHREEFGPFAALEDLLAVDGFDADRVAPLRGRARP